MNADTTRACTATEVEFLILYRKADAAGKRRLDRLLDAATRGLLPSAKNFTDQAGVDRFLDSLLETRQ